MTVEERIVYERDQARIFRSHVTQIVVAAMAAINPSLSTTLAQDLGQLAVQQYLDGFDADMARTFELARIYTPMPEGDEA